MQKSGVFKDVKILNFGQIVAGPLISTYMADYGAEVVHVESRSRPDQYRLYPPFKDNQPGINRGFDFAVYSHNRYGVTLDLRHPKGPLVAKRIIRNWANVVIENFTPGVMTKQGLGFEELQRERPDLIMLSTCNQGQTGPHATHPGMGSHLTHLSGFTHLTGWADRDPLILYGPYIDFIGVVFGAIALISALEYRRKTGKGQYLDIAQFETGIQFLIPSILDYEVNGRIQGRNGNHCDHAAPHGAYPCRGEDRWCVIAIFTEGEWDRFCDVLGRPTWMGDSLFSTFAARKKNEEVLDRHISEWTRNFTAEEIMEKLQSACLEGTVVKDAKEMYEDPHLQEYLWAKMHHPEIGPHHVQVPPFKLSKSPCQLRRPAPLLGEHNECVYRDMAGLSLEEYEEFQKEGVFH